MNQCEETLGRMSCPKYRALKRHSTFIMLSKQTFFYRETEASVLIQSLALAS